MRLVGSVPGAACIQQDLLSYYVSKQDTKRNHNAYKYPKKDAVAQSPPLVESFNHVYKG